MENIFYANNVNVGLSQDDVTLDFLYVNPANPKNPNEMTPILKNRVIISPTQAKKMLVVFSNCVSTYEKVYGEINLKPNLDELKKMGIEIPKTNN